MVDKINNPRENSYMLLFQDDGGGMDPEGIRRCMSLGFSNKKSKTTIGQCFCEDHDWLCKGGSSAWSFIFLAQSHAGVLEVNFIEPAHDKQDFERTTLFIRLETKLKQIIIDYWKNNCHLIGYQSPNPEIRDRQKGYDKCSEGHRPKTQQSPLAGKHVSVTPPDVRSGAYIEDGIEHVIGLDDGEYRREKLQRKETLLKQTIEELEREIAEAKRKCTRLAAQLEFRKNKGHAL